LQFSTDVEDFRQNVQNFNFFLKCLLNGRFQPQFLHFFDKWKIFIGGGRGNSFPLCFFCYDAIDLFVCLSVCLRVCVRMCLPLFVRLTQQALLRDILTFCYFKQFLRTTARSAKRVLATVCV